MNEENNYDDVWDIEEHDPDYEEEDDYDDDDNPIFVNYTMHFTYGGEKRHFGCEREDWAMEDFEGMKINPMVGHAHLTNNEDGSIIVSWTRGDNA